MANEAHISLIGFVATQPKKGRTKTGSLALSMRVGWTPRALNRATGEWSDLPSSFVTVQCYRKVAEHAAVCLRRGDPIVVRGTMRVREWSDQNGQRRSSVEVQADSIGHDMSRGISTYSKLLVRTDLTADEYEQSLTTVERSPLLGDRDQTASDGLAEPDLDSGEDSEQSGDDDGHDDMGNGSAVEVELAANEEYDELTPGDAAAGADDALEPIGSPA